MPNELIARNGLITPQEIVATGSITSVAGFTGSLAGTSSWSSNATSATSATTAIISNTATTATSSTYAISSSWASASLSQSIASISTNANYYFEIAAGTSGLQPTYVNSGTTLNPSTGLLTTNFVSASSFTGSLTGSVTGNLTGTASWATNATTATTATTATSATSASSAGTASVLLGSIQNSTYAISASFASASISSSYSLSSSYSITASNLTLLPLDNTSALTSVSQSNVVVVSRSTGSYVSAFYDYAIFSGSNARCGTAFGTWNGSTVAYTEYTTTDIGSTGQVTMSLALSSSTTITYVQLLTNAGQFLNWNVRAIGRYI